MTATSLIVINGVLRKHVGGAPVPEGIRLYRALAGVGQVVLLDDNDNHALTSDWLELHGLVQHGFVDWPEGTETHTDRANAMRRQGYNVGLVVESDPQQAVELIMAGLNTMLFTHAMYTRPDWRPDTNKGIQPWLDIVKLTAHDARMKAADARLRSEDGA